ncbi:hypothetical protein AAVH_10357 [Aphelenchoides avenae]|nr:hypothetical protein AAVH_10357 [Aphelenchus avenae]
MLPQLLLLIATSLGACLLLVAEASSPLSIQNKQKNRPACVRFYRDELHRICTAPDEDWPCFNGSKLDREGKIDHLFNVDVFARSCCSAACSEQEIREYFCCHTEECLFKCYGKSSPEFEVQRAHRLREAELRRLRLWQKFYPGSMPPAPLLRETK